VNADIPDVDVHFVEYPDTLHNAVGAKGIGEIGTVGMAAAVANAVYNATGIRVRPHPHHDRGPPGGLTPVSPAGETSLR